MSRRRSELSGLGSRIRTLRKDLELNQSELANRSELSLDAVHRIERGKRLPNLGTLIDIARALGKTPAELLGETPTQRQLAPRIARLVHFLETQPDEVVRAVEKCAVAISEAANAAVAAAGSR